MKNMKYVLAALVFAGAMSSNAALMGNSPGQSIDEYGQESCHSHGSAVDCFAELAMSILSFPTTIVGADGAHHVNPTLVKAVNAVLQSDQATAEQKAAALKRLNDLANIQN